MSDALANELFERAAMRRRMAQDILDGLDLIDRWRRFGRPVVVGALAYDLVVARDIDMEIYCPVLRIEDGFTVLGECAQLPPVVGVEFNNALAGPDKALYWKLRVRDRDGEEWKIDMWSAPEDYDLPRSEDFVAPMRAALTTETREAILRLKEMRRNDETIRCLSIDLYRAVIDGGVRSPEALRRWLGEHETDTLTGWKPVAC